MTTLCNKETGKAELAPQCGTGQGGGGAKISYKPRRSIRDMDTMQVAGPNDGETAGTRGHRLLREKEIPRSRVWKNRFGNSLFLYHFSVLLLLKD